MITGKSYVRYSPGIIFLDRVAGLKVNFVGAKESDGTTYTINYTNLDYTKLAELSRDIFDEDGKYKNVTSDYLGMWAFETGSSNVAEWKKSSGGVDSTKIGAYLSWTFTPLARNKKYMTALEENTSPGNYQLPYKSTGILIPVNYYINLDDELGSICSLWIDWTTRFWVRTDTESLVPNHKFNDLFKVTLDWQTHKCYAFFYNNDLIVTTGYWGAFDDNNDGYYDSYYIEVYRYNLSKLSNWQAVQDTVDKDSVAYKLQGTIATWYTGLRTIALVGLLSVLVYLGIRIILSSTSAQDKAKYKNMIKDWLVAICILFMLHYIMAFMLNLTGSLTNIIESNVAGTTLDGNTYDKLMSTVRDNATSKVLTASTVTELGYVIMYLALVILTVVFTFQYLKRVVFMAFLTMIAPMIALTYPLDKVKDGKAQAFSYWLREYIFNCLIQPVHLLLYTVLISSAFDFAQSNILYAIVALAFMVPAEKFIKEMFGMKSSSPTGQLGAAAGGAMVMSMINKMKNVKGPKDDAGAGGSSNSSGVRTANNTRTANSGSSSSGNSSSSGGSAGVLTNGNGGSSSGGSTGGTSNGSSGGASGSSSSNVSNSSSSSSNTAGSSSITGASRRGRGVPIRAVNAVASGTGKLTRKAGGALLGAAAGTIALAAQVADGDLFDNPQKALTDTLVGAGAGYAAGSAITGHIQNKAGKVKTALDKSETFGVGIQEYNSRQADMQVYRSEEYKALKQNPKVQEMCDKAGIPVRNAVQSFLNAGERDLSVVEEALSNGIGGEAYKAYSDLGVDKVKDMSKLQEAGIDAETYKNTYKAKNVDDVSKIVGIKKKCPNLSDAQIASAMEVAKNAPKNLNDFIPWAKIKFGYTNDKQAEALYKHIINFF